MRCKSRKLEAQRADIVSRIQSALSNIKANQTELNSLVSGLSAAVSASSSSRFGPMIMTDASAPRMYLNTAASNLSSALDKAASLDITVEIGDPGANDERKAENLEYQARHADQQAYAFDRPEEQGGNPSAAATYRAQANNLRMQAREHRSRAQDLRQRAATGYAEDFGY